MQGGRFFWSEGGGEGGGSCISFYHSVFAGGKRQLNWKKKPFLLFYVGAPPLLFPEVFSKADFHNQLSVDFRSDG